MSRTMPEYSQKPSQRPPKAAAARGARKRRIDGEPKARKTSQGSWTDGDPVARKAAESWTDGAQEAAVEASQLATVAKRRKRAEARRIIAGDPKVIRA